MHVRPLRVLLVEDNDYNVDVAKEMLEYMGHGVTVSASSSSSSSSESVVG